MVTVTLYQASIKRRPLSIYMDKISSRMQLNFVVQRREINVLEIKFTAYKQICKSTITFVSKCNNPYVNSLKYFFLFKSNNHQRRERDLFRLNAKIIAIKRNNHIFSSNSRLTF